MKNKNFRNPRIYQTLVEAAGLNEIGTNFPKSEFFDIEGYGPESYATGIGKYSGKGVFVLLRTCFASLFVLVIL